MDFLVIAHDRPDAGDLRGRLRLAHLEWVSDKQDRFKYGGPIQLPDGTVVGSVMILDLPDRAALDRHLAADPYFKGGLFETVTVRATRQVVPETGAGELAAEIERQKAVQ